MWLPCQRPKLLPIHLPSVQCKAMACDSSRICCWFTDERAARRGFAAAWTMVGRAGDGWSADDGLFSVLWCLAGDEGDDVAFVVYFLWPFNP